MTTKLVLSAPLPRVYEDSGNGRVVPVPSGGGPEPEAARIGGEFKVEELTRVSRETVCAAACCSFATRRGVTSMISYAIRHSPCCTYSVRACTPQR